MACCLNCLHCLIFKQVELAIKRASLEERKKRKAHADEEPAAAAAAAAGRPAEQQGPQPAAKKQKIAAAAAPIGRDAAKKPAKQEPPAAAAGALGTSQVSGADTGVPQHATALFEGVTIQSINQSINQNARPAMPMAKQT